MRGRVAFDPRGLRIPRRPRARPALRMPVSAKPQKETTMTKKRLKLVALRENVDRSMALSASDPANWPLPDGSLLVSRGEAAMLQGFLVVLRAHVLAGDEAGAFRALLLYRRAYERELLAPAEVARLATPAETTLPN
jgi:hypothetical protein